MAQYFLRFFDFTDLGILASLCDALYTQESDFKYTNHLFVDSDGAYSKTDSKQTDHVIRNKLIMLFETCFLQSSN